MARGRKPTPTKIKRQRGTARNDRVLANEVEYALAKEIPMPPDILNEEGRGMWVLFCTQASAIGILTRIAEPQILDYCLQWQIYLHSARLVANSDTPGYDDETAYLQKNYRIMVEARKQMKVFESEWGLTPASASRIPAPDAQERKESKWDEL